MSKSKRRRRIFIALLVTFLAALGWLLYPSPAVAEGELLRLLPNNHCAIEIRGALRQARDINAAALLKKIVASEAGRTGAFIHNEKNAADALKALGFLLYEEQSPPAAESWGGRQAWALGRWLIWRIFDNGFAVSFDPATGENAMVAKPDNLSWLLLRAGLFFFAKPDANCWQIPFDGTDHLQFSLSGSYVCVRENGLGKIDLQNIEAMGAGDQFPPRQKSASKSQSSLLVKNFSQLAQRMAGAGAVFSNDICSVRFDQTQGEIKLQVEISPEEFSRIEALAQKLGLPPVKPEPNLSAAAYSPKEANPKLRALLCGFADPSFVLAAFSHIAWPAEGRPYASNSQAMNVLLWEAAAKGLLPHADGKFALGVYESVPVPAPYAQAALPAPELRCLLGSGDAPAMCADLRKQSERVIDYFRAPGNPQIWEAVRRETALKPLANGGFYVLLNPIFFNGLQPGASPLDKVQLALGTHFQPKIEAEKWSGLAKTMPLKMYSSSLAETATYLDTTMRWNFTPAETERWLALLLDKADNHAWVAASDLPAAKAAAGIMQKLAQVFPAGTGSMKIWREAAVKTEADMMPQNRFWLDITLFIEFNTSVLLKP